MTSSVLQGLINDVYELTKRPDLKAETEYAVRISTLKMHQTDYYSKDIFETGVDFDEKTFLQTLDYIGLVPNLRSFKYFRKTDEDCDDAGDFIDIISVDEILDSYGRNRTDIAYVAGRILSIRSSTDFDKAYMGCYVHPIVTDNDYCSWIGEQYPYVIVQEATRVIFKTIGYDEQAATYERLVAEGVILLKLSALSDVGY
jgi:hypothetical protein